MSTIPAGGAGYFAMLTMDEQHSAIRRLARSGIGDHGIADLTGLAVEQIRRVLSAQPDSTEERNQ